MKLTMMLDAAPIGVRAYLTEEWDEDDRTTTMAPMIRLFDNDTQALDWGRAMARRRGLKQLHLTDNRKQRDPPARPNGNGGA